MRFFVLASIWFVACGNSYAQSQSVWESVPAPPAAADTLSFADVLARVKRSGPALRAIAPRVDAAARAVEQASARPNPFLLAEAENVDGSYSSFDQSELSLWLAQELELGGKRGRRVDHAARAADEVALAAAADSFVVYLVARSRYAAVVHAEERTRLARVAADVVAELSQAANERVRAGAALTADAALADAALARARLSVDAAEAQRRSARVALSTLWGDPLGFDEPVASRLGVANTTLFSDSASSWSRHSPAVALLRRAAATRRAEAALERSLRVPSLHLGVGARRIESDDATTMLFSLGLPLALWDRRDAAVRAAEALALASDAEAERAGVAAAGDVVVHIRALELLRARLQQTESVLAPRVAAALANMRTAYDIGRASYPDLLEVQRALLELEHDANDTRLAIVEATIAIEQLTGRTIEELMNHE